MRSWWITAGLALFAAGGARADEHYDVINPAGDRAGGLDVATTAPGTFKAHWEFSDRGRGPKIDAEIELAADGTPLRSIATGVTYMKSPTDERFDRADGKAHWKNASEDQTVASSGPAFYMNIEGTPLEGILLAQALMKAPEHRLPLLPSGEARIERVRDVEVKAKSGRYSLVLWAVVGLDLAPNYLWFDRRGRFFASWSSWNSLVRQGAADALPEIGRQQVALEQAAATARAGRLTHRLTKPLLIRDVRVFDPATLAVSEHRDVVVKDGRIAAIADTGQAAPAGAEVIEGHQRFLMPGLWDMHQHLQPGAEPLLAIASGVTSVRDLANDEQRLKALIDAFESGRDIGPRVLRAGIIDGRGPYAGPTKVYADDEAELVRDIDHYADQGYVQIKLYSSLKPELVAPAVRAAHARGLRLSGHVPAFMTARQFVEAGADEVQHINFIALNFLYDLVQDTRTPARLTAVGEHFADIDVGGREVQDFLAVLHSRGTVVDPTLSIFETLLMSRPNDPSLALAAWAPRLPAVLQRSIASGAGGLSMPDGMSPRYRQSFQNLVDLTGALYRAGVRIVPGTDGTAGFSLVRELELYVQAGIPPKETLRIATLGAAEVMKRDGEIGGVAPGQFADLILIDGDPTRIVGDLRKVDLVVRGDRWFDSKALYEAVGVRAR